eukprot:SAG22_NODE_553_length_9168_cov_5.758628_9_plen_104_part_00
MNNTTLEWYPVNGGLPQLANMTAHLAKWSRDIVSKIPDPAFSPIVGIDSEAWRVPWGGNDPRPMAEPADALYYEWQKSAEALRLPRMRRCLALQWHWHLLRRD